MDEGKVVIPDGAVSRLCEILDVEEDHAIHLLFQTNGDINQAVAMHLSEEKVFFFSGQAVGVDDFSEAEEKKESSSEIEERARPHDHSWLGLENSETDCWICLCPVGRQNEEGRPNGCYAHPAHPQCLRNRIAVGRKKPHISFEYLNCGICNDRLNFDSFESYVRPILELERKVALLQTQWAATQRVDSRQFLFYCCSQCQEPFFGGLKRCQASDADAMEPDTRILVCPRCSGAGKTVCEVHGSEFINYKCKFCCRSPATFICHGSTHYCEVCHRTPGRLSPGRGACPGNVECIFNGNHPPNTQNGQHEYSLQKKVLLIA
mmetsp:Transcript_37603/g.55123  ORF Transcript_37603/g.55123 Transcript_37603/m.55123 type:complete len:320 (-) Transcript_37603:115-1074(-)